MLFMVNCKWFHNIYIVKPLYYNTSTTVPSLDDTDVGVIVPFEPDVYVPVTTILDDAIEEPYTTDVEPVLPLIANEILTTAFDTLADASFVFDISLTLYAVTVTVSVVAYVVILLCTTSPPE